ncbi:cytochrome c biogenesis protein CcdA [Roseateles sp. GG27B]
MSTAACQVPRPARCSFTVGSLGLWWGCSSRVSGLAFTPCVLPMLPILSSIIVGSGAVPTRSAVFCWR